MSTTTPAKKYRKLLKTSKINNITIKKENGKYYAVVNITTTVEELEHSGENIGIDLGLKNLATLSNGQEIVNLDLRYEDEMISKYQKKLNQQKYMSKNYKKKHLKNTINGKIAKTTKYKMHTTNSVNI